MPGKVTRGEVIEVNLDPTVGTEVKKTRPCVVVQNDVGNKFSPRTIVVPVTDAEHVAKTFPVCVRLPRGSGGLSKASVALCDQIRAVDESRILRTLGRLMPPLMDEIDVALKISLGLK
jgi:mRNA interferase MazF